MKRAVWIVSEGSPGHVSQSQGLVRELARKVALEVLLIETRPRLNGFGRRLVRGWMGPAGRPLPMGILDRILGCKIPAGKPDWIVTSGGKAVFAARSLAARFEAPLVFIGERKPYPSEWFHTVLTPSPFETGSNDVRLDVIPTKLTREDVERAAAAWQDRPSGRLWTMIAGGASVSHRYTDRDWVDLALAMNALAKQHGIRWLVTTSRRTGARSETLLRDTLDPSAIADAIWWSSKPEKRLHALLGAAEVVFVTQDSVTMVTEAMTGGQPLVVVSPAEVAFDPTSFLPSYFQRLADSGKILRVGIRDLMHLSPPASREHPGEDESETARVAGILLSRLAGH